MAVLVGNVWLAWYFTSDETYLHFRRELWKPHPAIWARLLKIGLPAGAEFALTAVYLFLVYVIHAGVLLSWVSRARSFNGIPDVSYSWVTMSMPVGAALLLVTTLLKVRQALLDDGLLRPAVTDIR